MLMNNPGDRVVACKGALVVAELELGTYDY
jgi:hypothetical protein